MVIQNKTAPERIKFCETGSETIGSLPKRGEDPKQKKQEKREPETTTLTSSDRRPTLTVKEKVTYGLAIVSMVASTTAIFFGIFIEPPGEVHPSLLTYFGISAAFCGSLLGISAHYSSELTKFNTRSSNPI